MSDNAGKSEQLADFSEPSVKALFNAINTYYTNNEVTAPVTAICNLTFTMRLLTCNQQILLKVLACL